MIIYSSEVNYCELCGIKPATIQCLSCCELTFCSECYDDELWSDCAQCEHELDGVEND
jgi:hypothetical protein